MLRTGIDTRDLQVLLGHASIKSTTIYDDRTGAEVEEATRRLNVREYGFASEY